MEQVKETGRNARQRDAVKMKQTTIDTKLQAVNVLNDSVAPYLYVIKNEKCTLFLTKFVHGCCW